MNITFNVGDLFNLVVKFPGNVCEPTRHIVLAFEATRPELLAKSTPAKRLTVLQ